MTRTTITAIAHAIKAGVRAHYAASDQAATLERLSELLLDMAASLEMEAADPQTHSCVDRRKARYADLLGELGWQVEPNNAES